MYRDIEIKDKGKPFNTNLRDALEIGNLLELSQVIIECALNRKESRGAHFMEEYPNRDDVNYLKHTIAMKKADGVSIRYIPVRMTKWKPEARVY